MDFSADTIREAEKLKKSYATQHVGKQLIRSSSAPMAHHGEAQAAESMKDFIHKMKMGHKELRESIRWLRLINRVPLIDDNAPVSSLISENDQLIRIFHASIKTATSRE